MKTYEVLIGNYKYIGAVKLEGGMAFIKWKNILEEVYVPTKIRRSLFGFKWTDESLFDGKWGWKQVKDIEDYLNPCIVPVTRISRMIEV